MPAAAPALSAPLDVEVVPADAVSDGTVEAVPVDVAEPDAVPDVVWVSPSPRRMGMPYAKMVPGGFSSVVSPAVSSPRKVAVTVVKAVSRSMRYTFMQPRLEPQGYE